MHAICHVDDIGYVGSASACDRFRKEIESDFGIDDLGRLGIDPTAKRYLGIVLPGIMRRPVWTSREEEAIKENKTMISEMQT